MKRDAQETANVADLMRQLSLDLIDSLALKRHLRPCIWGFLAFPDKNGSLSKLYANNMIHAEQLLSFWELEFWCMVRRGCLHDQILVETVGAECLTNFSSGYFIHVTTHYWGN